jgi:hypothetical protein
LVVPFWSQPRVLGNLAVTRKLMLDPHCWCYYGARNPTDDDTAGK